MVPASAISLTPTQPCSEILRLGAVDLAPRLLGWFLVRDDGGSSRVGRIVETEAYPGGADRASHTFDGRRSPRTLRNASMWKAGGHAYVYFTYGMHFCCNVVSGPVDSGEAVLIRAVQPLEGLEAMRSARQKPGGPPIRDRDLGRGPARLCVALGIDRSSDGVWLLGDGPLRLRPPATAEGQAAWAAEPPVLPSIACGPRIGIGSAGPSALAPWRFWSVQDRCWVSGPTRLRQECGGGVHRADRIAASTATATV